MPGKKLTKVLFVDDDEDTLTIARYALQSDKDLDVKYVFSGAAALKEVRTFRPDLILLDVMMPNMDGMETLKELRKLKETEHTPVIFFTAKVQKEELSTYKEAGVVDVIVKPFDPLLLRSHIQKIWERFDSC